MEYIIISLTTNVNTNVSACESIDISICLVDTFCHLSTLISSDLTDSKMSTLCERPVQPHCDEIADVSNLHDELLHNTLNDVIEVPSNAVTDSLTWNIVENLAALVGDSAVPFELLYPSGQHDGELRFGTDDDPSPVAPVTAASDEASASNSSALAATGNSSGAKRRVRQKKKSTKRGQHSGNGSNDLDRVATSEARQAANGPVNVSNHSTSTGAHCPSTGETVTVERVNHRARQQSSRQFPVNRVVHFRSKHRTHCQEDCKESRSNGAYQE